MAKTVAIVNQRAAWAHSPPPSTWPASLGVLEKKTLLVDADPQANATSGVGYDPAR